MEVKNDHKEEDKDNCMPNLKPPLKEQVYLFSALSPLSSLYTPYK